LNTKMMNMHTSGLRVAFLLPGDKSGKACSGSVKSDVDGN